MGEPSFGAPGRITTKYLWEQILAHVELCFTPLAQELIHSIPIEFGEARRAGEIAGPKVFIPTDIPTPLNPQGKYSVEFGNTRLTLWNPISDSIPEQLVPWPNSRNPLWLLNKHGAVIPAWNLFGNLSDLLTLREERCGAAPDRHGRFEPSNSPRYQEGLLEVPAFNESIAALVACAAGLRRTQAPATELQGLVAPPTVVLSHDCDILRGNDVFTQAGRLYNSVATLRKGRPPKLTRLWSALENGFSPKRYFYQNLIGMLDLERQFGFRSISYMLTGTRGRFGNRSGSALVREFVKDCPDGWEIGIHYNYDTFLEEGAFQSQKAELEKYLERTVTVGRAHYLRFDGLRSPAFLAHHGIRFDGSFGYSGYRGYRLGMAGLFSPLDEQGRPIENLKCLPLHFMDVNMRDNVPLREAEFVQQFDHIASIGGVVSVVFHPGNFFNPEFPEFYGLYARMLAHAANRGARSKTPSEFLTPAEC